MRFSSLFQLPPPTQLPRVDVPRIEVKETPSMRDPLATELPDDLDARVRLVGEWQIGEG